MSDELVLVTGGSGFVGAHCVVRLLTAGYRVRTTLRSLARADEVRQMIRAGGVEPGEALSFAAADLTSDEGWPEAVAGCDYVLHVASPFPPGAPRHEDELIVPAREGTLRVLRAAREAGVRRVVITSNFGAIGYGHGPTDRVFTEADWADLDGDDVTAYIKSKTLAERAAWEFVAREGGPELAVVNPVGIFGPALGPDYSGSIGLVRGLLLGAMPGLPRMYFGVVDVRDVADLELRAMTDPAARGERFLATAGEPVSMAEVAAILRSRLGATAARVPTREMTDDEVREAARQNPAFHGIARDLGKIRRGSSDKARRLLGWTPRTAEEAITATAESLVRHDLL
ncbi:aldehyde reductase [Plantactinospora sp. B5E13]|uniref:SDR family oxidoreductase n=1 Tax=unclassified Plantactinospora TaxID=2631981 RepID=UPI00325D8A93